MSRRKLSDEEIAVGLSKLEGWKVDGEWLKKRFDFRNFALSLDFVNKVGEFAEEADHHPDIKFGWGYVEIELTTHDTGGLTQNDFDLAGKIQGIDH
ncbi:MAG: 4a-hydroxytetrahydrobiopterin dehydratase [Acidobacteria bacterium]|nr:MAG: 4a-hydroxytetrahydrobiopterin dehydratase [Acidobacteriota bacterium]REJ98302.1 MAG: 4a-hydroxytetrahydrobiopterin dehydratase [Acidobacteriota bacterium]REK17046.1 MAG: 4a-hydroxytetrahydrobiopterin dehydratase [Acidobacteriota bacterium]REK42956.1 MAG: 4a-hydroxytetrahydrobiopterin dehydratase [Acidobacteriota bacterium]